METIETPVLGPIKSKPIDSSSDEYVNCISDLNTAVTQKYEQNPELLKKTPSTGFNDSLVKAPTANPEDADILITITNPRKINTAVSSYVIFTVNTKLVKDSPHFSKSYFSVNRRLGDFMTLRDNLAEKHKRAGFLVPLPPERNLVGMTIAKMTANEDIAQEYIEKRRAALERFINRVAKHDVLGKDDLFMVFLKQEIMPKQSGIFGTANGLMKFVTKPFSNSHIELAREPDDFYEKLAGRIQDLEQNLSALRESYESHMDNHKDVAANMAELALSLNKIGRFEESKEYSRSLQRFAQCLIKLGNFQLGLSNVAYDSSEILKDHYRMYGEMKDLLHMRCNLWETWNDSCQEFTKIRSNQTKMEEKGQVNYAKECQREAKELAVSVDSKNLDFKAFSSALKTDVQNFEQQSISELRQMTLVFLFQMIRSLERSVTVWKIYLNP